MDCPPNLSPLYFIPHKNDGMVFVSESEGLLPFVVGESTATNIKLKLVYYSKSFGAFYSFNRVK